MIKGGVWRNTEVSLFFPPSGALRPLRRLVRRRALRGRAAERGILRGVRPAGRAPFGPLPGAPPSAARAAPGTWQLRPELADGHSSGPGERWLLRGRAPQPPVPEVPTVWQENWDIQKT